jgi:phage/plasmid primase-like uncharacterized protein
MRQFDWTDIRHQFRDAMRTRHLVLVHPLEADGHIHRCDAGNKEHGRGKNDGAYVLHPDGWPAGAFCNYTDGKGWTKWKYQGGPRLSREQHTELMRQTRAAQAEASRRRNEAMIAAARKAARIWKIARPASASHRYLVAKDIQAHGARVFNGKLVVPLYAPKTDELMNLQYITDRSKWHVTGGRKTGCYYRIKGRAGDPGGIIAVCASFSTGATIQEATGFTVYVAFGDGNLLAVARMVAARHRERDIIIIGDDDWKTEGNPGRTKAYQAARAISARVAVPHFGNFTRKDGDTDFNDLARSYGERSQGLREVRVQIASAELPSGRAEAAEPDEDEQAEQETPMNEAERDRLLDEVAQLTDPIERDRRTKELAHELGARVSTVRDQVERRRAQRAEEARAEAGGTARPSRQQLAASARQIIDCEDVLRLFAADFADTMAGESKIAKLLYLAGTSRLLDKTMHVVVKGPSAVGKSALRQQVLRYFPPEDVIEFTSLSEKALLYIEGGFEHKILSMGEAQHRDETNFQDYLLREIMSANRLRHMVPVKSGNDIQTVVIEKRGPVVFIVTTTANKLNPENETRMLSVELDDSAVQTRQVLRQVARTEGLNWRVSDDDFQEWHDFQRWLAAGPWEVVIPYAEALADLIRHTRSVRLRRDVSQLLVAIKAHALIHRQHRKRNRYKEIVATIREDYAAVRRLLADVLATASDLKTRAQIADTVAVVRELQAAEDPRLQRMRENAEAGGFTVREIADKLRLDISAARRRLVQAEDAGFLVNLETRPRRPGRYQTTPHGPDETGSLLPTPEELWTEHRRRRAQPANTATTNITATTRRRRSG